MDKTPSFFVDYILYLSNIKLKKQIASKAPMAISVIKKMPIAKIITEIDSKKKTEKFSLYSKMMQRRIIDNNIPFKI